MKKPEPAILIELAPASAPDAPDDGRTTSQTSLRRTLIRRAAGSFGLIVASSALGMLTAVLLARIVGLEGYGLFAFVTSTVTLLRVPAVLGAERLLVRNISVYEARSEFGLARGLIRRSRQATLAASLALGGLAAGVAWLLSGRTASPTVIALWIGLLSLPMLALARVAQATTIGLHHVVVGQIPELLLRPLLFIGLALGAFALVGPGLMGSGIIALHVASAAFALAVAMGLLAMRTPQPIGSSEPRYDTRAWMMNAVSLALLSEATVINAQAGTVLLGAMVGPAEAGLFSVAYRGANLITFAQLAVNAALSPTVARLWAQGEVNQLQRAVTGSARAVLIFSLPFGFAFIIFGTQILAVLFGQEFAAANGALAILSVGQLVNAASGSVATLLVMTGHERHAAVGVLGAAIVNVLLTAILIPTFSVEGAAIGTTASMILWNISLAVTARRRIGIDSTAMGARPR